MSSSDFEKIRRIIDGNSSFIITGHVNPDGDAIGSCCALALALEKTGKNVVILLEQANTKFNIIPGRHLFFHGDISSLKADVLFCLDCSTIDRLGEFKRLLTVTETTVSIDHHINSEKYAKNIYADPDASSTAELIYLLLNGYIPLDKNIASAIYAGIVYDTGGFRHGCTTSEVMRISAELLKYEIPFTSIYNELMFQHTVAEALIFGTAISNMKIYGNSNVACSLITIPDFEKNNATLKDLDGIVEYILNIRNIEVSVLFYEKKQHEVKVSFRSIEKDVCRVANKFGGGGHKLAAGCTISACIGDAVKMILPELLTEKDMETYGC